MNNTQRGLLALIFASLLTQVGCAPDAGRGSQTQATPFDEQAAVAKVREVAQSLTEADSAGDLDRVMSFYLDDALLLPPGEPEVWGIERIRERYRKLFEENRVTVTSHSVEILLERDWAVDRGWTKGIVMPKRGGKAKEFNDKYIMMLKRDGAGEWKIARLMWN